MKWKSTLEKERYHPASAIKSNSDIKGDTNNYKLTFRWRWRCGGGCCKHQRG